MPKKSSMGMFSTVGTASVIGLHMVSGIVVGCFFGWLIDDFFGTKPVWTMIFIVLGIIASFMNVYRDTKRLLREQKESEDKEKE